MITYNGLTRYDSHVLQLRIFVQNSYLGSSSDVFFPTSEIDFEIYSSLEISNFLDTYDSPELYYLNNLFFDDEITRLYYIRREKFKKVPLGALYSLNSFKLEKLRQLNQFLNFNFGSKLYFLKIDDGYFSLSELKFFSYVYPDDGLHVIEHYDYNNAEFRFNPYGLISYRGYYNLPYLIEYGDNSKFYVRYLALVPKPSYTSEQLSEMPEIFRESVQNLEITNLYMLNSSLSYSRYFNLFPSYTTAFFVIPSFVKYVNHFKYSDGWTAPKKNETSKTLFLDVTAGFYTFGNPAIFYFGIPTEIHSYYLDDFLIGEIKSNFLFYSYSPYSFDLDYPDSLDNYSQPSLCCLAQCFGITE